MWSFRGSSALAKSLQQSLTARGLSAGASFRVYNECEVSKEKLHQTQISKGSLTHVREQQLDMWLMEERDRKISHKKDERDYHNGGQSATRDKT